MSSSERRFSFNGGMLRRAFSRKSGLVYEEKAIAPIDQNWHYRSKGRCMPGKVGAEISLPLSLEPRFMGEKVHRPREDAGHDGETESVRQSSDSGTSDRLTEDTFSTKNFGTSSLHDTIIKTLAQRRNELHADILKRVPWQVIKPLWNYLRSHDLVSVHVWRAFATAFPYVDPDGSLQLRTYQFSNAHIFIRYGYWARLLEPIISPSPHNLARRSMQSTDTRLPHPMLSKSLRPKIEFLAHLEAANVKVSREDLLFLPELYNLHSLTLGPGLSVIQNTGNTIPELDAGIFGSWVNAANTDAFALTVLRSICLRQRLSSEAAVIGYLSQIPALKCMRLQGPAITKPKKTFKKAIKHKWSYSEEPDGRISHDSLVEKEKDQSSAASASRKDIDSKATSSNTTEQPCDLKQLPSLQLRLVGPDMEGNWQVDSQESLYMLLTRSRNNLTVSERKEGEQRGEQQEGQERTSQGQKRGQGDEDEQQSRRKIRFRKTMSFRASLSEFDFGKIS